MSFDARAARALEPGKYLTSPEHPGLRLAATESGHTWSYRYRSPVDDRLRQVKIGAWPATSVHAAIVAWEGLRARREAGEDPAEVVRSARAAERDAARAARERRAAAKYTVADVAREYLEGHVVHHWKPKGATELGRMFERMLGDTAVIPATELTRAQAFALIEGWAKKAPVQAGKLRTQLGAAWEYAYDAGRLEETVPNWWPRILKGRVKSKGKKIGGEHVGTSRRFLSADEVARLVRWMPNFPALLEDVLTLYLWTGTRGAEICGITGAEVALEGDGVLWWTIPKERTKNARFPDAVDLRVPLFGRARLVVERRKARFDAGPLFPARVKGEPRGVGQKTIQSSVWTYQPYSETTPEWERPRLPVTHWAPHDLRRTARTLLAALGCPNEIAEAVLGHMPRGIVGVYNRHTYDKERAAWLKQLSDHLESLAMGGG
jgi:integrase